MLRLPGLIDPHVHLREPGGTHKEDFHSGTAAALAGGYSLVLAMPNTDPPLTDGPSLQVAKEAGKAHSLCDFGLYLGGTESNHQQATKMSERVCGLKLYVDQTYGTLQLKGLLPLMRHVSRWPAHKPLAVHAEGRSAAVLILLASLHDRPVHLCHVSRREEIMLIRAAKEKGLPVTCEVTPHHLFLTEGDASGWEGGKGRVQPPLASPADRDALWENLPVVDCLATDHAPHTLEEKLGPQPPPGFPGLETALSLMYGAVLSERLTLDRLVELMHEAPQRIFSLPSQEGTWIEVDETARWRVKGSDLYTRCSWSPYEGMNLKGKVVRVFLRGEAVYQQGNITAEPGCGRDLFSPGM